MKIKETALNAVSFIYEISINLSLFGGFNCTIAGSSGVFAFELDFGLTGLD